MWSWAACRATTATTTCAPPTSRSAATLDLDFPITVGQLVLSRRRRFLGLGRRPGSADRAAADEALAPSVSTASAPRALTTLSGGQAQRALLARALAQEADLVLLDEALSGVDQPRTEALLDLFARLRDEGTTLLVATHDLALARRRFDRCLAVNGRLVADGAADVLDGHLARGDLRLGRALAA